MKPLAGARLTVINPDATAPYTGMLPGFVAGHYTRDELDIDLVRLARFANARLIFGKADGIDRIGKTVSVPGRPPIPYDLLAIDIGITSNMPFLEGFDEFGIPAKPLDLFAERWSQHLAAGGGPAVVIGGGLAGVELAMAMRHAMKHQNSVTLIEAETALRGVGEKARTSLLRELAAAKIEVLEQTKATAVRKDVVVLDNGSSIPCTFAVGAAGARPYAWLQDTGLPLEDGYIAVDETLRALNEDHIFAVGDCAHLSHAPRPKAGVFAVRAAPVLTHNLRAAAMGKSLRQFNPQTSYLKLVSLGRKSALADKWGRALQGDWAWTWKDKIDRKFMDRLNKLEPMAPLKVPAEAAMGMEEALGPKPLCGGCGAKVGSGTLDQALAALPAPSNPLVIRGAGDDAAVLSFGAEELVLTTDHLRAFWSDPYLFARIAVIHALGDIWSMGATPQAALINVTLPPSAERHQKHFLTEVLQAAQTTLTDEGASLVGGHSSIGAEFSLGFTLTGKGAPIQMGGAQTGDALILTRPIGSGTILAAEMGLSGDGRHVRAALETMACSQADAAQLLAPVATAMTDVTGFGLAGHAARLATSADLTAEIILDQVPLYEGAQNLSAAGIRSSLWQSNRDAVGIHMPETAIANLMFDPQTAGGLLASVPQSAADGLCSEICALGHQAAVIGSITAPGSEPLIFR